jgi:N-acetylglucosaminyl-diphospho-decaprenol L-rhamnosyltransferase
VGAGAVPLEGQVSGVSDRRVAAVIVNYNTRDYLLECVRSLRADGMDRVVVVDNDSVDGSVDALRRSDPDAEVIATGANLGFGVAANRGVARAVADYVLILNPDTVVEPGTVKALVEALERDARMAAVGPRIHSPDGTLYPSVRRFPDLGVAAGHAFLGLVWPDNRYTRTYRMLDWDHNQPRPVDWVSGTCMLVRRGAFEAVGGFDPAYFMYVEDVDLCWRLWRAGWTVGYEPGGLVTHTIGGSSQLTPYRMILAHHLSLFRFAERTTEGPRRAVLPAVAAGLALRTVLAWARHGVDRTVPAAR